MSDYDIPPGGVNEEILMRFNVATMLSVPLYRMRPKVEMQMVELKVRGIEIAYGEKKEATCFLLIGSLEEGLRRAAYEGI